MNYYELENLLARPTVRVLAIDSAPLILGFFSVAFKGSGRSAVPEDELRVLLQSYLEELHHDRPNAHPSPAADYLNDWCKPERGFLRRYYIDGQSQPLLEMTASSEKALLWLESLRETEFVATESRLEAVFKDLGELVRRASSDPDVRVAALLSDIEMLHAEIDQIRATGAAETYTAVQINERFGRLLAAARELVGDFRQVEENFRSIASQIAERQAEPNVTKGAVVGHMLDAHDALRASAVAETDLAPLRALVLGRIKQLATSGAIWGHRSFDMFLYRWRDWANQEEVNAWLKTALDSPARKAEFVGHMTQYSVVNGSSIERYLNGALLEKFTPIEQLSADIADIPEPQLTKHQILARKLLARAVSFKAKGHGYSEIRERSDFDPEPEA